MKDKSFLCQIRHQLKMHKLAIAIVNRELGPAIPKGCSRVGLALCVSWQQPVVLRQRPEQWQALVRATLPGSGSASLAAWLPGLCFERNILAGWGAALIQIGPHGLPC